MIRYLADSSCRFWAYNRTMRILLMRLLRSPEFEDKEASGIARQLHITLLIGIPIALLFPILILALGGNRHGLLTSLGVAIILIVLFGLLRRKYVRFVSFAMVLSSYCAVIVTLIFNGGIRDDAIFTLPLILLMASVFLGGTATFLLGLVTLSVVSLLYVAELVGWIAPEKSTSVTLDAWFIVVMTIALMTVYLRLTVNQIVENSRRIQQQSTSLQKSNQELKNIRRSLERRTTALSILNDNLRTAQKQLVESEKMAALGSLVAGVAHEINTPLGAGITAASTLEDETHSFLAIYQQRPLTRADLDEYLERSIHSSRLVLSNLQQAANLVQSFKQVAVDQANLDRRIFLLRSYLEEVIQNLQPTLKGTKHRILLTGDETIELNSYPGALAQVVTNLVINSIMHGYPNDKTGLLQLCCVSHGQQVHIEYTDDGVGIPPENLNHIFEPFFTTARDHGGTGLGLHIVYNLVTQKMGGTIACESTVGVGTKFMIILPV